MPKKIIYYEDQIKKFMETPDYRPLHQHELAKKMQIRKNRYKTFRKAIASLHRKGRIVRLRKNRWTIPQQSHLFTGTLSVISSGHAFFTDLADKKREFFIPRHELNCALDGDRVQVEIIQNGKRRPGKPENDQLRDGRVVKIVDRKHKIVVGSLRRKRKKAWLDPDNSRLPTKIQISSFDAGLENTPGNHKVALRLNKWTNPREPLTGQLIEDIGRPGDPGVDMHSMMLSHGIEQKFPEPVRKAAQSIPTTLSKADRKGRRDLRKLLTFTIDPESARDFDDAVSIEKKGQGWRLSVHIADVAHFVKPESVIDKEGRKRGNSVYLVDRVIMMLPSDLTTGICSLNPHVDRLAHSVFIDLDKNGKITGSSSASTVIHSDARLIYEQVQEYFDHKRTKGIPDNVVGALKQLRSLVGKVRALRVKNGSLELNTPQIECILDDNGDVETIHRSESKEAYELVEECMLLANRAVGHILTRNKVPTIYRIHSEPDQEQWAEMGVELKSLGIEPAPTCRADINRILKKISEQPIEYSGTLAILRNFQRAEYSLEREEHFGLALENYVHFTSPIRRYPDIIIHRILRAIEEGRKPPEKKPELAETARHCSQTEREADAAEKESLAMKRVQYYDRKLRSGKRGPFQGIVVNILRKGVLVELPDTLQRGLVPYSAFRDDYYEANRDQTRAVGKHRKRTLKLGDILKVELDRVDIASNLIDFRPAAGHATKRRSKKRRRRK